jgi:hypothetical protein
MNKTYLTLCALTILGCSKHAPERGVSGKVVAEQRYDNAAELAYAWTIVVQTRCGQIPKTYSVAKRREHTLAFSQRQYSEIKAMDEYINVGDDITIYPGAYLQKEEKR